MTSEVYTEGKVWCLFPTSVDVGLKPCVAGNFLMFWACFNDGSCLIDLLVSQYHPVGCICFLLMVVGGTGEEGIL